MTNRPALGISLMVVSMLFFALCDGAIKAASPAISGGWMILWLGVGGVPIFAVICAMRREMPRWKNFFHPLVLLRNLAEAVGSAGIVIAVTLAPLTTVSAIHQSIPVIVTLGAVLFLKETVGWRRWSAIVAGFCFVLMIIKPGTDGFDANLLFAVAAAVGLSVRDLATRALTSPISTMQLSLFGYLTLIPVGVGAVFIETQMGFEPRAAMNGLYVFYAVLALLSGVVAYVAVTSATRIALLSVVAPFRYTRLVFALIMGIFIFGERLDGLTIIGAVGIVGSGLFLLLREKGLKNKTS